MRVRPLSLLLTAVVSGVLGCADRREPAAREHLREQIAAQSSGALALASMTKTNGFDHGRDGMRLHTIEWEARVTVQTDGWKAGWRDYQVLLAKPNALAAAVEGVSVRHVFKGATAVLQGKSELQKADRGWRVLQSEVTAFKLLPPPDAPSEGRSTDIQAFFAAFKQAVASKNKQSIAKFIDFPLHYGPLTVSEAQFHATFFTPNFPLSDDEVRVITETPTPAKREDGTYGIDDAFGLDFQRNQDGYWKWTSFYYNGD